MRFPLTAVLGLIQIDVQRRVEKRRQRVSDGFVRGGHQSIRKYKPKVQRDRSKRNKRTR